MLLVSPTCMCSSICSSICSSLCFSIYLDSNETTPPHIGTERCLEAVNVLEKVVKPFDIVINIQGDEPLIEPHVIDAVVQTLMNNPDAVYRYAASIIIPQLSCLKVTCLMGSVFLYYNIKLVGVFVLIGTISLYYTLVHVVVVPRVVWTFPFFIIPKPPNPTPNPPTTTYSTACTPLPCAHAGATDRVKCVVDQHNNALYFSRSVIPGNKAGRPRPDTRYLLHLGLQCYDRRFLSTYCALPATPLQVGLGNMLVLPDFLLGPCTCYHIVLITIITLSPCIITSPITMPLQLSEDLEQLKVLENGYKMKVCACVVTVCVMMRSFSTYPLFDILVVFQSTFPLFDNPCLIHLV